jgi:hypothetical protein
VGALTYEVIRYLFQQAKLEVRTPLAEQCLVRLRSLPARLPYRAGGEDDSDRGRGDAGPGEPVRWGADDADVYRHAAYCPKAAARLEKLNRADAANAHRHAPRGDEVAVDVDI